MALNNDLFEIEGIKNSRKRESVIPKGIYCYDEKGRCPYWDCDDEKPDQGNGYCWFLDKADWEDGSGSLLWDQCKECGINEGIDENGCEEA